MLLAFAALTTGCVKTPDEPETITFSVLGDSYSALEGTLDPETNDAYHYDAIGITEPEQMWWNILARKKGWVLDKNNSFSGSLICNYNYVNYYGAHSFIRRMDNLGQPDVIFIFGATNDACAHNADGTIVSLGDYIYSGWTEEQLCSFRPALAYLYDNLKRQHPNAKLYFLIDMHLGSGSITVERRDAFIESIHHISSHYGVDCIDLQEIHKDQWHPDAKGQQYIANTIAEYLASVAV